MGSGCPLCVLALSITCTMYRSYPPTVSSHARSLTLTVPLGTHLQGLLPGPGRSPPGWWSRRCRCPLQPPARRSRSLTPTSSRIPPRCSAPWDASCPTNFPFKMQHATHRSLFYCPLLCTEILHHFLLTAWCFCVISARWAHIALTLTEERLNGRKRGISRSAAMMRVSIWEVISATKQQEEVLKLQNLDFLNWIIIQCLLDGCLKYHQIN